MHNQFSSYHGDLLIVDDLADNLRVLSNALSNHGYRVRAVRNGAMALIGARAVPPDVILLDIRMPEMDGYEVCRQLKADPETCDISVIFLSALDEMLDKAKAFEVGGVDYITKPFQIDEVLARVKSQTTIQRLRKQLVAQQQELEKVIESPPVANTSVNESVRHQAMNAITTILDYSTRLCQNPATTTDQYTALRVIYQNGLTLLDLINDS